ncbi:MAG: sulfotransferase [Myxococcota bacterium]
MTTPDVSLEPDDLLAEASQRADGLTDLGEEPFREGLERFSASLESEGKLNPLGRVIAKERALGHAVNRLRYVDDRKTHPEIAKQEIEKPVFIVGLPRTGTTILHDILAKDPSNRAPMTWETMFPSPPPEAATFDTDPRIAQCAATFPDVFDQIPGFKAMHPMGAELTQECVTMMGEAMITPLFHNQFRVPSYQDWVDDEADFGPVYAFHRKQLQHLQSRHARDRWILKTGAHMWGLAHLLETYPDARIVFTHRDPVDSMTSYASLTSLVRTMGSDSVDREEIAADWTARLQKVVARTLAVRNARDYPDAQFTDVLFSDFVADPFATVRRIYEAFGIPMSAEAEARVRAFIDDNPKGKHGVHEYAAEDYGVDPRAVRDAFAGYVERFGLAP